MLRVGATGGHTQVWAASEMIHTSGKAIAQTTASAEGEFNPDRCGYVQKEEIEVFQCGLAMACERQRKSRLTPGLMTWTTTLDWPLSKEEEAVEGGHWSSPQTH